MLIILDSSALINQPAFEFFSEHQYVMTPKCADELKEHSVKLRFENALKNNDIKLQESEKKFELELIDFLKKNGISKLSSPDLSLLALAFQFQFENKVFLVYSDDYDIQNVLSLRNIPFDAVLHGKIKKTLRFQKVCKGCKKLYPADYAPPICSECGSLLKNLAKQTK